MLNKKKSKKVDRKYKTRQRLAKVEAPLEEQFQTARVLGKLYNFSMTSGSYIFSGS